MLAHTAEGERTSRLKYFICHPREAATLGNAKRTFFEVSGSRLLLSLLKQKEENKGTQDPGPKKRDAKG